MANKLASYIKRLLGITPPERRKWYSYYESWSYLRPQYIEFLNQFDTYEEFDEFMTTNLSSGDWYCYKIQSRKITLYQCMEDYFSKAIPRSPQQEFKFKG